MSKIFYSKSINGFYFESIHGKSVPEDSVLISQEEHIHLLEQQSKGKIIGSDDDGRPVIKDREDVDEPLPSKCSPAQWLVSLFLLKQIKEEEIISAIGSISDIEQQYLARIGYAHAKTWERDSPTMKIIADLLHLTDSDMDALFAKAVTVQV